MQFRLSAISNAGHKIEHGFEFDTYGGKLYRDEAIIRLTQAVQIPRKEGFPLLKQF